jgi:Xaa-Pro aminopeptidase
MEREGYALLTKHSLYIFASGLNNEAVRKHIANKLIKLVTISPRSSLTKKVLLAIVRKEKIKRLGFEKYNLSFAEFERLREDLQVTLVPTEYAVEELRTVKDREEVSAIAKACELGDKAFKHILMKIKLGMTEKELAFELEYFMRKSGADISFPPIVAFGSNSSIPHHVSSNERLTKNSWVLLDFGATVDNYCSDMTRTVFFGKANTKQKRIYETVRESQSRALAALASHKKSARASRVDSAARDYIMRQGFPTIPHSLGHGIGIEVHELPHVSPKSKSILRPQMVFSVEPGIYIPVRGGVRIEDLVVLEPSGPKLLTKSPRVLIEI